MTSVTVMLKGSSPTSFACPVVVIRGCPGGAGSDTPDCDVTALSERRRPEPDLVSLCEISSMTLPSVQGVYRFPSAAQDGYHVSAERAAAQILKGG